MNEAALLGCTIHVPGYSYFVVRQLLEGIRQIVVLRPRVWVGHHQACSDPDRDSALLLLNSPLRQPFTAICGGLDKLLVSVREQVESSESFVIQVWWPDSRRGHQCGRQRTAGDTIAAHYDIRAI